MKAIISHHLSLQIINPKKKKEYRVGKIKPPKDYTLKNIQEVIEAYTTNKEFGYIEPGHSLKGKREWLLTEDFLSMINIRRHEKCDWC